MFLILLEALGAGCILVVIVWWTMFSGRSDTEAQHQAALDQAKANNAESTHSADNASTNNTSAHQERER